MLRAGALTATFLLAACQELTIVSLGEADGVPPFWYAEELAGLPPSFTQADWPDGERELILNDWQSVVIEAETLADGAREIRFTRRAWLLDAELSALYRDVFGVEKIGAIRDISLDFEELSLEELDRARTGEPRLQVAGLPVELVGTSISLDPGTVRALRDRLLAGEDLFVPFSIDFRLGPDALDALPSSLRIDVVVQPTLYVDVLAL